MESCYRKGMRDGVPIFLGYLAVSFTFGITAVGGGLPPLCAVILSAVNYTSAGQFAALDLIRTGAPLVEMALTTLLINLRYLLMSCALSQKLKENTSLPARLLMACGVTDEVFGAAIVTEGKLDVKYALGLMTLAMPGWVLGTALGAVCGEILPARALSALGVALYAMFLAIVLPPARKSRVLLCLVPLSMAASWAVTALIPALSSGFRIILLTLVLSGAAAYFFPVREEAKA